MTRKTLMVAASLALVSATAGYLVRAWRTPPAESADRAAPEPGRNEIEGIERDRREYLWSAARTPAQADRPEVRKGAAPAQPGSPNKTNTAGRPPTPREERDTVVAKLRNSGTDAHGLINNARAVGDAWAALARTAKVEVVSGNWECYAAGCFTTMLHTAAAEIDDLTTQITETDGFRNWDGPKMRSGPVPREDGKTEVTWVLFVNDQHAAVASAGP